MSTTCYASLNLDPAEFTRPRSSMATITPLKPDSTPSTATPFTLGDTLTGSLNAATDKDYFAFTTTGARVIQLDISDSATALTDWAYRVSAFDSNGTRLAGGFLGPGTTATASFSFAAPGAGTYYIGVGSSNTFSSAPYTVATSGLADPPFAYEHEGNDTLLTANTLALDHTLTGQLGSATDVDDYVVDVAASGTLILDLRTAAPRAAFEVAIDDPAGKQIDARSLPGGMTLAEQIDTPGKYTIHIQHPAKTTYTSDNYALTAHLDSGSARDNAVALADGTPLVGGIAANGHNWYKVHLQAGGAYEFSLAGAASQGMTLATPSLVLAAQDGHVLGSVAHWPTLSGSTPDYAADPQIGFVAPYSGTFYLQAGGLGNAGTYTLTQKTDALPSLVRDLETASSGGQIIRWASTGGTTTVTYAFMTDASLADADGATGFVAMTPAQADAVRQVLALYSSIANITFQEVGDPAAAGIRFGTADETLTSSSGVTYPRHDTNGNMTHADVYIANAVANGSPATATLTPGGHGFETLIHETGHALGLKHPGNYNSVNGHAPAPFMPAAWDNAAFSLMSYLHDPYAETNAATPQLLDVTAIQSLYGVRTASTSSFAFAPGSEVLQTILSGGTPLTLDFSKATSDSLISLTPGTLSSVGLKGDGTPAMNNLALPFSASVKEVFDGSGNDYIIAGANNVKVHLGSGLDTVVSSGTGNTILGGGAADTVEYTGNHADFRLLHTATGYTAGAKTGSGADTLTGIDSLAFNDGTLALPYNDAVEDLYVAYFGRPADYSGWTNFKAALAAAGAPTYIQGLNTAYGASAAVRGLVDAFGTSAESAALYGNGTTTDFVNAIYQHVLNRAADSDGLRYWAGNIDTGVVTKGDAALSIMAGALANHSTQGLIDGQVVTNKMLAATNFTLALDTDTAVHAYAGDAAAATVRAMLGTVGASTDTAAFESVVLATLASLPQAEHALLPASVELPAVSSGFWI